MYCTSRGYFNKNLLGGILEFFSCIIMRNSISSSFSKSTQSIISGNSRVFLVKDGLSSICTKKFKENDQYKKKTEIMDPVITLNGKNVTPRPLFDSSKSSCENKLAFSSVTFDDILQHTSLCSVEQNIFPWILDRKDEGNELI